MSAKIKAVTAGSPCDGKIQPGETLISIDGAEIVDVLDYMYHGSEKKLLLQIEGPDGRMRKVKIKKERYEDMGLDFESYLMDEKRHCANKCIFCFIDQLPKGMRETLYFKDDDARMSLLRGNYITLTNLSESEIERIIRLKISPVNISVHTTNPKLRVEMMKNPRAEEVLPLMKRFAKAGIKMNCQIVLCNGINDGEEMRKTIRDLMELYPAVESLSVVPVGITRYRDGLYPLQPFEQDDFKRALTIIVEEGDRCKEQIDARFVYPGDEFFLGAKMDIPSAEFYDEFPQLENGVGMMSLMKDEFNAAFRFLEPSEEVRECTVVTGVAAADYLRELVNRLKEKWPNLKCNVEAVKNEFFGPRITVAGLVTGGDIIKQLAGKVKGKMLIPACMLRYDRDRFLDDVTLEELEEKLSVPVEIVDAGGDTFIEALLGKGVI